MTKNFFIFLLCSVFFLACKKKNQSSPEVGGVVTKSSQEPSGSVNIREMGEEGILGLLRNKANDTLYVTNFFATWCGPCVREIPHFVEEVKRNEGKKVKFTFVSLDNPSDWDTKVCDFVREKGLKAEDIVLFNAEGLEANFFKKNTKSWSGQSIPFTLMTIGEERDEILGFLSSEELSKKIKNLLPGEG